MRYHRYDNPVVAVAGTNIEKPLRILRKRLEKSGVFRILSERKRNPSPADRKRLKKKKAQKKKDDNSYKIAEQLVKKKRGYGKSEIDFKTVRKRRGKKSGKST